MGDAGAEGVEGAGGVVDQAVDEHGVGGSREEARAVEEVEGEAQESQEEGTAVGDGIGLMVVEPFAEEGEGEGEVALFGRIGDVAAEEIEGVMTSLEEGDFSPFGGSQREHFIKFAAEFFHFFVQKSPLCLPHSGSGSEAVSDPAAGLRHSTYILVFCTFDHHIKT